MARAQGKPRGSRGDALQALGGQLTESGGARLRVADEVGGWRRASILSISCSTNGTMRARPRGKTSSATSAKPMRRTSVEPWIVVRVAVSNSDQRCEANQTLARSNPGLRRRENFPYCYLGTVRGGNRSGHATQPCRISYRAPTLQFLAAPNTLWPRNGADPMAPCFGVGSNANSSHE
jgi:hypothetical protein